VQSKIPRYNRAQRVYQVGNVLAGGLPLLAQLESCDQDRRQTQCRYGVFHSASLLPPPPQRFSPCPREAEPALHQLRGSLGDHLHICIVAGIALLDRKPWIADGQAFGLGMRKRKELPVLSARIREARAFV
jgi:hypothetical protein